MALHTVTKSVTNSTTATSSFSMNASVKPTSGTICKVAGVALIVFGVIAAIYVNPILGGIMIVGGILLLLPYSPQGPTGSRTHLENTGLGPIQLLADIRGANGQLGKKKPVPPAPDPAARTLTPASASDRKDLPSKPLPKPPHNPSPIGLSPIRPMELFKSPAPAPAQKQPKPPHNPSPIGLNPIRPMELFKSPAPAQKQPETPPSSLPASQLQTAKEDRGIVQPDDSVGFQTVKRRGSSSSSPRKTSALTPTNSPNRFSALSKKPESTLSSATSKRKGKTETPKPAALSTERTAIGTRQKKVNKFF